jgi:vitamin B12 transporter
MKQVLIIILSMCFHSIICAQTNVEPQSEIIDEVIIKDNRLSTSLKNINRSVEVIQRKEIINAPIRSIAELLSFVSSIDIRQRGVGGVQADINILGGTFDQTLVLIDGIAIADPQTGHHSLNLPLDIQSVERIEIHKGAGARIFGQNAFAGVINIVTRKNDAKLGFSAGLDYGNFKTINAKAGINGKTPIGNVGLFYSNQSSDGYRANSDYKINNLFFKDNFDLGIQKISILAGRTKRSFGASGFYAGPATNKFVALPIDNNTDEFEEITTSFGGLTSNFSIKNWDLNYRISGRTNKDDYYFVRNTPIFNKTNSVVMTGEINSVYNSSLGKTGFGVSYQKTNMESLKLDTTSRNMTAVFLEHKFSFINDKLTFTPGLTYNDYSDFGNGFFPGIDVGYWLNNDLKVYGSWNNTFRIPTYTDLYFQNGANLNNPNLIPEKSTNVEIGGRYSKGHYSVNASWFSRNGTDIIDRTKASATDAKWLPANLGKLDISGIETALTYTSNSTIQKIKLSFTYLTKIDYNKGQNIALSRYAADQLRSQINFSAQTKIYSHLSQGFNARYFERYTLPVGFEGFYKGVVADYKLLWSAKNYVINLQVNNILDKKYTESNGITMPGRWLTSGVEFRL